MNTENENFDQTMSDHSVIIYFDYCFGNDLDPLFELSDQLSAAIENNGTGYFDGNEINMDGDDGSLYMYGPNAEDLFKSVKPILEKTKIMSKMEAVLRFGSVFDKDAKSINVKILGD